MVHNHPAKDRPIWFIGTVRIDPLFQANAPARAADPRAATRALGADATINYRTTPAWAEETRRLTDGRGADLVIDIGGASTLNDSFRATRMGGAVALVGVIGGGKLEIDVLRLFPQLIRIRGIGVGSRAELIATTRAIAARQIHPVIDREFAFEESAAAFRHLKAGAHFGKVVIRAA